MSSRALRKLQKEQEVEKQLAAVREAEAVQAEQDEESEEDEPPQSSIKPLNAFDMLDGMDDEDEDNDEEPAPTQRDHAPTTPTPSQPSRPKKKKKKAKKKGKGKAEEATTTTGMDDIDRALQELSTKPHDAVEASQVSQHDLWLKSSSSLLSIDSKNLNPVNEMKSLFGNVALEVTSTPTRTRRNEEAALQGGMDLGTALTGRQCLGTKGKELGPLAHRRNIFMQGREEWPGATSGGLSMEYEKMGSSFEKKYNIMHDRFYQETQVQFMQCVATMDPQNLISLLRLKPYHIATLLQVSEIAKVQGDHSVSGDLLERALFSFGRSVHSTFGVAIKEGIARLSFSKAANRELYLSIWRYIRNLEQRGTWKTAFEWTKALLQLDPARDPYGVTLMIDQLALRGRQHTTFIEMCSDTAYGEMWDHLPNIQISLALAHHRNKSPIEARQALAIAIHKYPYILSELAKSLEIEPLPRILWGKLPSDDAETLYTQLYVTRAKDLWNTPELTALLVEVAETLDHYRAIIAAATPATRLEISLEEARHILLLEIPALIGLLPRKFTNMRTSMSDPLPPPDSTSSGEFTARVPAGVGRAGMLGNAFGVANDAAGGLLDRILGWWHTPAENAGGAEREVFEEGAVRDLAAQLGVEPEEAQEILARYILGEEDALAPHLPGAFDTGIRGGDRPITMEEFVAGREDGGAETDDSLPELESISGAATPPNPLAARVEEGDDEDAQPRNPTSSGALLRRIDSDDEEEEERGPMGDLGRRALGQQVPRVADDHPEPSHTIFASTSRNPTQSPIIEAHDDIETTRDPQRIQRWLLSSGFDSIKDGGSMAKYVDRLKVLPKQQRDWTIRMVEQRGGKELAGRVRTATGD